MTGRLHKSGLTPSGPAGSSGTRAQRPGGRTASLAAAADASPKVAAQVRLQASADTLQRREGDAALQRQLEEEEPLQGKAIQCQGEEEELQMKPATTGSGGLPAQLSEGIAALSGHDVSDVRVHRNSAAPAAVGAHAFAQGTHIHVAPGQDRHLPHEAWHVVQQREGRVPETTQVAGVPVNDDAGLEREADSMGQRAATRGGSLQRRATRG